MDCKIEPLYCVLYCYCTAVDEAPSARWGHALCMVSENEAVLIGGQGDKNILCKDAIWQLDMCKCFLCTFSVIYS